MRFCYRLHILRFQVHVHLGERSVCCSIGIGGSFASQFITKQLGPAADSLTAAASGPAATAASAGAAVAKEQAGTHLQKIEIREIIRRFSELFVSQGECNGTSFKRFSIKE